MSDLRKSDASDEDSQNPCREAVRGFLSRAACAVPAGPSGDCR